jgi:hypothetical protein
MDDKRLKSIFHYFPYLLLGLVIIYTFYSTYSLHTNYPFPYHHDEWQHLGISKQAIDEGYNKHYNPFLGIDAVYQDLESGFHLYLASLILFSGLDPLVYYQYLAAVFAVISGFSIFVCVSRLSKNTYAGIISSFVFSLLKSNVNVLGKDYFVPLTMAIPFIFTFILFYAEGLNEKDLKKFIFSLVILIILFFIHPPSAIILMMPAFFEAFFHLDAFRSKEFRYTLIALLVLVTVSFAFLINRGDLSETKKYFFDLIYFEPGWGKVDVTYFIPFFYGGLNAFYALVGLFYAYKTRLRFFAVLSFASLAITSMFNVFGFTFLAPYSRALHYSMLALIPLTAYGIIRSIEICSSYFSLHSKQKIAFSIILVIIFAAIGIITSYSLDMRYKRYSIPVMSADEYDALLWIKENLGENNTIISPYFMTSAVYTVSGSKTISLIPAVMGKGDIDSNLAFYNLNATCDIKYGILQNTKANIVLTHLIEDCSFLKQIYSKKVNVYAVLR